MSTPQDMPSRQAVQASGGTGVGGGQRFGRITCQPPSGPGPGGRMDTYFVRTDDGAEICSFSDADIVTEGFRTIRTGERVRFLTDPEDSSHALYVIRLDLPDVEEYYK